MAESSSVLESRTSNPSSDDLITKSIQETIDVQVGLVPDVRNDNQEPHEVNLSTSLDQIEELHVEQGQELVPKDETHLINLSDSPNQTIILDDSSRIEAIDEGKEEQNVKKEGKKEKRVRKRGKGLKKNLNSNSIHDFERQNVCDCDRRGDRARVRYIREDMEALRYSRMDDQKKKWIEVYCGLGSVVAKEYDGLGGSVHDEEENYVNFDPRPLFASKKGNELDNVGGEMQNTNQVDHVSGVNGNDLDGSLGGEEDDYEDEDSDSELFSIQRPAFLVTGEPDFDSGPPQDGLEYLRRVRDAFNKEQTVYMPNIPEIAACPEHIMPSKEWEDALSRDESSVSTFSSKIEPIPLAQSIFESVVQENLDFCQTDDGTNTIQENLDFCQTEDQKTANCDWPSLRTILEMEPVARVTMLRKRITSVETVSSLSRNECAWLFALCAAIDTPLDADTSASLRCLLRKCATLRAQKSGLDDEVIMLNILVTISGQYFGQAENKLV
ncbi:Survival motor neuron interacting protein 1 [Cynara cardunculus var. scolymus]|uniref:Survival motor neuron interacting protein 1 n=1 Tax=Cynara cardunculus var. scolymus TaxID=59895 RepID=A0A103XHT7_CYNCS|nr:Survival motor neuron interacting protein 1 [Cynara cardunculus var. scolymus]